MNCFKMPISCFVLGLVYIPFFGQGELGPSRSGSPSGGRQLVFVDGAIRLIHEKGLRLTSALQASQNSGLAARNTGLLGNMNISPQGNDRMSDLQSELPNGSNYYVFKLAPKECLKLELQCESTDKVWMQFVKTPTADEVASAIRRANLAPKSLRSRRIAITNPLDKPYEVVLALYGRVNFAFDLLIGRNN